MKSLNYSQESILKLLESGDRPISAQRIWAELHKQGNNIGIATVYRNLEALKLKGLIYVHTTHNEAHYSPVSGDQYFATCLQCGQRVPLPVNLSENIRPPSLQLHFDAYYHTLEVFGLCAPCKSYRPA